MGNSHSAGFGILMIKWLTRLTLWPIALLGAMVAGSFFLIQQEPVQQFAAARALKIVNRMIAGSIEVEHITVRLHGAVNIFGFVLRDENGKVILTADRVNAWLAPWDIVRGRVHVLKADVDGMRGTFSIDSTGNNYGRTFTTAPSERADSVKTPIWVRLDRLKLDVDSVEVEVDTSFKKTFLDHKLSGDILLTDSVITYDVAVLQDGAFTLTSSGVIRPYTDSLFAGDILFEGTSQYVQDTWIPELPDVGDIKVSTRADILGRDLTSLFDVSLTSVGTAKGDIEIDDYRSEPRVSLGATFTQLDFSAWLGDSIAHEFSGRAALTKSKSAEWTHDWSGRIELDSSFYGDIDLTADVEMNLFAEGSGLAGEIRTNAGQLDVRLSSVGFNPDSILLSGHAAFTDVRLHTFVSAVPDSLSPLTGRADFSLENLPDQDLAVDATLALGTVSLGRYELDSLAFHAIVDGSLFTLDSTRMRLGSATALLTAHGDYTQSIVSELSATVPEIEEFRALLAPYLPQVDSLSGDLTIAVHSTLEFAADTLYGFSASGTAKSLRLNFGKTAAFNTELVCESLSSASETMQADISCYSLVLFDETITPVKLTLDGGWQSPQFSLAFAARGDTLTVAAIGTLNYAEPPYSIEIEDLSLNLFGTSWRNDFPVIASFDSLHYEIEALILRSDYGVLRSTGYLENPGQQDLVVEFSGFQTGALSPILRKEIPNGNLNVRLQVSGSDTAVAGNIELVIDSVTYQDSPLADEVKLTAELDNLGMLRADLVYLWDSDTALVANATLPASFSMQTGLHVPEGEQLNGTLHVDSLPLERFVPWMSAGSMLQGFLSADLKLKGSALEPNWDGEVHLVDGFYRDSRFGIAYKWIVLDADLQRDSLNIRTFRATSRGTMTGSGSARLGVPWPEELNLNLNLDHFEAVASRIQKARVSGNINLSGPFDSLNAAGSLTIEEGFYRLTQSATKTIEWIDMDSVLAIMRGDSLDNAFNPDALYESMSLNLFLDIPGNFWIRGSGLNTELFGELHLEKDHYRDALANGEIAIRTGTVKFYGQELRISENSSLRFDGPADSPELSISADYNGIERERSFTVTVKLTGTPDRSMATFSGKWGDGAAMSEDEAIQRLLPFANLGDGGGFDAGKSVFDAASGQVSDIVSSASGLDVFEFRPGPGGLSDLSSGQLELGTYVTDRLFIRVFQPIEDPRSGQKVSIDYRLLDWMKVTAVQESSKESTSSSSFTVYLQFEWR